MLKRSIRDTALVGALLLGLLVDQVVRAPGRPGLNFALWAVAGTAVLWLLSRRRENPVSRETWWLIGGAVAFAGLLALRDAEALAVFCLLSTVVLLGLAAGRGALEWAKRAYIMDVAAAAARVAGLIAIGPLGWSLGASRQPAVPAVTGGRSWPRLRMVARGTVMALPPLLVLGALLTSADPVFERVLQQALFAGIEPLLEHVAFVAMIAWLTSGYLRAFLVEDEAVMERVRLPRPALAPSEIAIALSLLNVLFLVFLAVQVRYLFGGASLVEVTEGLTYAEYARRGFFELVAAAAFVVPVLLVADWAAAEDRVRERRVLRATSTLLVVLLAGVLASAAYRMKLYQDAYGLTEQRLYVSVFMVWLTGVLGWLAVTVLRGRRRGFPFAAIAGGLASIAALHVLNPHALIARVNIRRSASGAEFDAKYLRTLSADAVPTLIAQLTTLPNEERCRVAAMLKERWSGERRGGWRTWNLGDARARRLVAEYTPPADCPAAATPIVR
ncbi:MAG TPA: DUF4173 domain-containing protein [Gemmatimonadaceae bacterium]|nr:DUF4173 domain-containing protein [Gemmatimonadaceae bacterium]